MALLRGGEADVPQTEAEDKRLLQSQPQRLHLPNCELTASCYQHLPGILDGSYLLGVLQPETSFPEEMHSPPGTVPLWCTQGPELHGPAHPHWAVATPVWSNSASAPYACQQQLLAVSFPLHSTTEQVSLKKWLVSPSYVRVEIRH